MFTMITDRAQLVDAISHRSTCTDPTDIRIRIGAYGDKLATCFGCAAYTVIETAEAAEADRQPETGALPETRLGREPITGWRCSAHPDNPVHPTRGTGCRQCSAEAASYRESKAARRTEKRRRQAERASRS